MDNSNSGTVLEVPIFLTVIMNKGGVGKTTTCSNLAAALCEKRPKVAYKVGVIDLDPQANISSVFGTKQLLKRHGDDLRNIGDFFDTENFGCSVRDFFYPVERKFFDNRLFILPGDLDLEFTALELEVEMRNAAGPPTEEDQELGFSHNLSKLAAIKQNYYTRYRDWLKKSLAGKFDFVIIDTPPSRGFLTQFALAVSDYVLPTICPGSKELDGLLAMEELIVDVWREFNPDLYVAGVLINNIYGKEILSKRVRNFIFNRYKGTNVALNREIGHSTRIAEALSADLTIFENDHREAAQHQQTYRGVLMELASRALGTAGTKITPAIFEQIEEGFEDAAAALGDQLLEEPREDKSEPLKEAANG